MGHKYGTSRRTFITGSAALLGIAAWPGRASPSQASVEIILDEKGPHISPDNFGYLFEMGSTQTEGVYVGKGSKIPNINGFRKSIIGHMREMGASLIRWPGGITADYYDWRDGVGPQKNRPRRIFWHQGEKPADARNRPIGTDFNMFGTDEFMAFCKLTGSRPFLGVNVKSLDPRDFYDWIEYCNAPALSSAMADLRAGNGSVLPYDVRYWSIGNEMWGDDGAMLPEEFVSTYKRFATLTPQVGVDRVYVAAGAPPVRSLEWVRIFMEEITKTINPVPLGAMSIHYYAGFPSNDWPPGDTFTKFTKRNSSLSWISADNYDADTWYHMLAQYDAMEDLIDRHWAVMAVCDTDHVVKLVVDEWGAILKGVERPDPLDPIGRPVTLRDALGAALTLDIFNRHSDKVMAACFNGLINHEGAVFQTWDDKFLATPVYDVFRMYASHQGAALVRAEFRAPPVGYLHDGRPRSLWGLNGSASLQGRMLTLTVVNPHVFEGRETQIALRGGVLRSGKLTQLSASSILARNSFEQPDAVRAKTVAIDVSGPSFVHTFPPASVSCLALELQT